MSPEFRLATSGSIAGVSLSLWAATSESLIGGLSSAGFGYIRDHKAGQVVCDLLDRTYQVVLAQRCGV